jgi:NUMOD3 motif
MSSTKLMSKLCTVGRSQGKEPWNKGLKLSNETRMKMSAAKLGRRQPKATRTKMSRSHVGLGHTPETAALLSAALAGRPKTQEHRDSIAASQRRRHAAARVLQAVEDVHRRLNGAEGGGAPRAAASNLCRPCRFSSLGPRLLLAHRAPACTQKRLADPGPRRLAALGSQPPPCRPLPCPHSTDQNRPCAVHAGWMATPSHQAFRAQRPRCGAALPSH